MVIDQQQQVAAFQMNGESLGDQLTASDNSTARSEDYDELNHSVSYILNEGNHLKTAQNHNLKSNDIRLNKNLQLSPSTFEARSDGVANTHSNGQMNNKYEDHHLAWYRKTRFHVAILGLLIAVVNCYAQATFCIAIVEMVLPSDFVFKGESSQLAVVKVYQAQNEPQVLARAGSGSDSISIGDNSCPLELQYRDYYDSWRFPVTTAATTNSTSTSTLLSPTNNSINLQSSRNGNILDVSNRFDWDASSQGLLLGAFAIGTAPLQILGGRLAEIYGAKWVLFVGCIGTALTNLTIPLLAHFSFILLILNRVLMGVAQAGMEPGLMCLLAEWMTPTETGFFISMLLFAICIGFFLGSLCSSFLLTLGYGWPITYYVAGGINLLVAIFWLAYANSRPKESRLISIDELKFIENEQRVANRKLSMDMSRRKSNGPSNEWTSNISPVINNNNNIKSTTVEFIEDRKSLKSNLKDDEVAVGQAPWINILKTRSVWAFIICKISIRWCADVLSTELPTYLANVLHLSIKLNGIVNSVSSALFALFSFLTGYLVNRILQNQSRQQHLNDGIGTISSSSSSSGIVLGKTNLRKLFQSIASFGAAISLFLMTSYDCSILFSMSMLLVLSCCVVMGTGGELQIPYDMTSKYPGTLHGMACTLSVSGWLAPPLIGLILGDQPSSRYRWSIVWYLTALINLIGGLVFVLFADASPRDFDSSGQATASPANGGPTKRQSASGQVKLVVGRGRHKQAAIDCHSEALATSGGYYNAVCKSADNSPTYERNIKSKFSKETLHHKPIDQLAGIGPATKIPTTCGFSSGHCWNQAAKEKVWTSNFDSQPIRVRQVEDSFIRPYYLNALDSVATSVIIFPYRAKDNKQQLDSKQRQQGAAGSWPIVERVTQAGGEQTKHEASAANPIGPSLWSRIRGHRRKFCIDTSRSGQLIGLALQQEQRLSLKPEAPSLTASVRPASIVLLAAEADVLPHYRGQQQKQSDHPVEMPEDQLVTRSAIPVSMTTLETKTITHL